MINSVKDEKIVQIILGFVRVMEQHENRKVVTFDATQCENLKPFSAYDVSRIIDHVRQLIYAGHLFGEDGVSDGQAPKVYGLTWSGAELLQE